MTGRNFQDQKYRKYFSFFGGWKKSCTTSKTLLLLMHNLHPRTPKLSVEWHVDRWCRISVTRTNPFSSLCLQTILNGEHEVSNVGFSKWCRISSINSSTSKVEICESKLLGQVAIPGSCQYRHPISSLLVLWTCLFYAVPSHSQSPRQLI